MPPVQAAGCRLQLRATVAEPTNQALSAEWPRNPDKLLDEKRTVRHLLPKGHNKSSGLKWPPLLLSPSNQPHGSSSDTRTGAIPFPCTCLRPGAAPPGLDSLVWFRTQDVRCNSLYFARHGFMLSTSLHTFISSNSPHNKLSTLAASEGNAATPRGRPSPQDPLRQ